MKFNWEGGQYWLAERKLESLHGHWPVASNVSSSSSKLPIRLSLEDKQFKNAIYIFSSIKDVCVMATLAQSFLADLDELSEEEEEVHDLPSEDGNENGKVRFKLHAALNALHCKIYPYVQRISKTSVRLALAG